MSEEVRGSWPIGEARVFPARLAAAGHAEEAAAVAKARNVAARALEVITASSSDPEAVALAREVVALLKGGA